jgi:hypothetical protein
MADLMFLNLDAELEMLGCGPQHLACRTRNLRPDTVAGQNNHSHFIFLEASDCGSPRTSAGSHRGNSAKQQASQARLFHTSHA